MASRPTTRRSKLRIVRNVKNPLEPRAIQKFEERVYVVLNNGQRLRAAVVRAEDGTEFVEWTGMPKGKAFKIGVTRPSVPPVPRPDPIAELLKKTDSKASADANP